MCTYISFLFVIFILQLYHRDKGVNILIHYEPKPIQLKIQLSQNSEELANYWNMASAKNYPKLSCHVCCLKLQLPHGFSSVTASCCLVTAAVDPKNLSWQNCGQKPDHLLLYLNLYIQNPLLVSWNIRMRLDNFGWKKGGFLSKSCIEREIKKREKELLQIFQDF